MTAGSQAEQLLQTVEELLPAIQEAAPDIDAQRTLPDWLVRQLTDAGVFRMLVGVEHGGLGTDPVTTAKVIEAISRANASVGWVAMILSVTPYWVAACLEDGVDQEFFQVDPPVLIGGTQVPHGRAVKTEGGWRLTGQWPFASACHHTNWLSTGSWMYEGDEPMLEETGSPMWRLFLSPASSCRILDTWHTTGLRGTGSHNYTMTDVFVPDRLVLKHPAQGEPLRTESHYAYPGVSVPMLSAVSLGAAQAAVDGLMELLREKVDRRNNRPVSGDLEKQVDLAKVEYLVGSARAYLYDNLSQVWLKVQQGQEIPLDLRGRLRTACTSAVMASIQAVDLAYAAAGATSIYTSSSIERCFRDVHTAAAHAFIRPATLADGGKLLLGQEPDFKMF
jgi:alkylation response protein AidB-like acyl-CoA dehydrogenase